MKYILFLICFLISYISSGQTADNQERCMTMSALDDRIEKDREYRMFYNSAMAMPAGDQNFIPCDESNLVLIPVAFHFAPDIVQCSDESCILAEVQDQLDALNSAFADNSNSANEAICPAAYQDSNGNSVASSGTCIRFCMAVPPEGTSANLQSTDAPITIGIYAGGFNAGGDGAPGWDGILNIFITNDANCLGVADGIPGRADGDGVTVCAQAFGGVDPASCGAFDFDLNYNLGATLIHEVGHYLGLFHTHVDGPFTCGFDSDVDAPGPFMVNDTPPQPDPTFGCYVTCEDDPSCPGIVNEPTANFMAYSFDACMSMFTEDQAAVMNYWARKLFGSTSVVCNDLNPFTLICVDPTCDDGMRNGSETGIDCGGPDCIPCVVNPACASGSITLLEENFDGCVLPEGWSVTSTEVGDGIFFTGGPDDVAGGGMPSFGFQTCIAIIDDDIFNDIGIGCIISPVIDLSTVQSANLNFDWQHNDFFGSGDFSVDVYDGDTWVQVFLQDQNGFGTDEFIDLAEYSNADFKIRFCHDDEGAWVWATGFDNVGVCGIANASFTSEIPTMGEWGFICLTISILICSVVAIRERSESTKAG